MSEPLWQQTSNDAINVQMARLRAALVQRLWRALAGVALLMLPLLLWRAQALWSGHHVGSTVTNAVFIAAALFMVAVFPVRARLWAPVRTALPVAVLVTISIASLFVFGAASTAFGWMVQCCFLIATLYSLRAGLWATAATAACAVLAGALFLGGVLVVPVDLNAYFSQPVAWLLMVVAVTLVPAIIVYAIGDYQRTIAALLRRVEDKRDQLDTMSQQLTQALAAQQQASAAKGVFLAHMTHELRTPLTGVIGMLEIADKRNTDANLDRVLTVARHSADALLKVINDVLDYSKLDAGKIVLEPEYFDLNAFLRNALEVFHWRAREKGIAFGVHVAPSLPTVRLADPQRLRQVLFNLISNGMKFTEVGSVELEVTGTESPESVRFSVRDTGIGIAPQALTHLFEEFEQADSGVHKRYGGTGLGLAISKSLVEAMGGRIDVHSIEGTGSVFSVTLPMPLGTVDDLPRTQPQEGSQPGSEGTARLHILLAEDSPTNQLVVSMLLRELGHSVVVADNGNMAVACAARENFDLILMDMRMPQLAGCEAAALIRQGGTTADTVFDREVFICAFTANATERDRESALSVGMNDFLTKPVRLADMQALLQRVVAFQQQRGIAVAEAPALDPAQAPSLEPTNEAAHSAQAHLEGVFRRDLAHHQEQLQMALQHGHWAQARETAHLLKGAALAVGARALADGADALERSCLVQPPLDEACAALTQALVQTVKRYIGAAT